MKRWPTNRPLDPMAANVEFGRAFQPEFRRQFRKHVDLHESKNVQGLNIASLLFPSDGRRRGELTAVNNARQIADEHGLPYGPFIGFCMDFASERGTRHIARPNQLIPTKERQRQIWDKMLEQFCRDFPVTMTEVYRVQAAAAPSAAPGCLGVPGASGHGSACEACPMAQKCADLAAAVVRKAVEKKWATYAEKEEALRLERNKKKAQRQRDVRSGHVTPTPRRRQLSAVASDGSSAM